MKYSLLVLVLLWGCVSSEPPEGMYTLPALIRQTPLPPWPYEDAAPELTLAVKVRVGTDGSVLNARLVSSSADPQWDSLALAAIKTWQYAPALVNGQPTALWVQQTMRVRFEQPLILPLAVLRCDDENLADSLYRLLLSGVPFDSLARQYAVSGSGARSGRLGAVDLRTLPHHIRTAIVDAGKSGFTKPLSLGRQFVIYKRLPNSV